MKITIVYDNEIIKDTKIAKGLRAGWGFSCFIQTKDRNILLDTGWDGDILISNMKKLGIDPQDINIEVISHSHWDHIGGIAKISSLNKNLKIYLPQSFSERLKREIKKRSELHEINSISSKICHQVYTTGEIEGSYLVGKTRIYIKEQSLLIFSKKGLVVISGCAHSGVGKILKSASEFGKVYALIGGLHDFEEYHLLKDISLIVPTHCTINKNKIIKLFPKKCLEGGVGFQHNFQE